MRNHARGVATAWQSMASSHTAASPALATLGDVDLRPNHDAFVHTGRRHDVM